MRRVWNWLAPIQREGLHAALNGKPFIEKALWSTAINEPSRWLGPPFAGVMEVYYDQWRLLFRRWPIRRRRVVVAVFVDGQDPICSLTAERFSEAGS